MQKTILDPQIHPKWSPGTRFGSQNGPEFTSESPKIRKIVKNNRFLPKPFTEHFLAWIWAGFGVPRLAGYVDYIRGPRIPAAQYIYGGFSFVGRPKPHPTSNSRPANQPFPPIFVQNAQILTPNGQVCLLFATPHNSVCL